MTTTRRITTAQRSGEHETPGHRVNRQLADGGARRLWHARGPNETFLTCWAGKAGVCIVQEYSKTGGVEIYLAHKSNDLADAMDATRNHLGI